MSEKFTEEEKNRIIEIHRDLHSHPEISDREFRTTKEIKKILASLDGVEILELPMKTGVLAVLRGTAGTADQEKKAGRDEEQSGRTAENNESQKAHENIREIALRADIDAIQQTEKADVPFKSLHNGIMHACGHDLHTAGLIGAAMYLSRMRSHFSGQVDFIFQPAEEITRGAGEMISAGLFRMIHPQRIYGIHNWPDVPAGCIVAQPGPRMAAKINFRIAIKGRGGHGSCPQDNVDPIVCAAAAVQSLQTIVSRNIAPMDNVICSVNSIRGGSEQNLVVDEVQMTATIRSLQPAALKRAWERARRIIGETAEAYECRADIHRTDDIPAVVNPDNMADEARAIAALALENSGIDSFRTIVPAQPALASEDFSFYMSKAPSWFFWVGSGEENKENEPLHSPLFCPDESAALLIAQLYAAAVLYHL